METWTSRVSANPILIDPLQPEGVDYFLQMISPIRGVLERVSRKVVLLRRLPDRFDHRKLYVTPDAGLAYWRRDLDKVARPLLDWAEYLTAPGDVVWDIGANVGVFSIAAAARGCQVLALEPDPWLAALITRSAGSSIRVVCAAASDRVGTDVFHLAQRGRAANFLARVGEGTQAGGVRTVTSVPTVTLDHLLEEHGAPSLIKVDVEGAEPLVWKGAERMIKEIRPRFICEVSGWNRTLFSQTFTGYDFFDVDRPRFQGWGKTSQPAFNTLAVPT